MTILLDETGLAIALASFIAMGVIAVVIYQYMKAARIGYIGEIYEERNGVYYLLKRVGIPVGSDSFHAGEHDFVVDPDAAEMFTSWNHFGGPHPTIKYDLRDSKPLVNSVTGATGQIKPFHSKLTRTPKPSSASTNLIFRRKGLQAMMQATKNVSMNPLVIGIAVGVAAFAGAMLLSQFWHPGLVSAPPAGYYYKVVPIPTNATVVTP